jgi:sugar phosphate isomerase/epimerase
MAGLLPAGVPREAARMTYLANLRHAAGEAAKQGVDVLIEPINTRDIPGFFLNRQDDAHAIVQEVGAANLKVQFDLYHCQIVEGDVAMKIRQYLPTGRVGHFQIAGVPERHEPDVGRGELPVPLQGDRRRGRAMRLAGLGGGGIPACAGGGGGGYVGRAAVDAALTQSPRAPHPRRPRPQRPRHQEKPIHRLRPSRT